MLLFKKKQLPLSKKTNSSSPTYRHLSYSSVTGCNRLSQWLLPQAKCTSPGYLLFSCTTTTCHRVQRGQHTSERALCQRLKPWKQKIWPAKIAVAQRRRLVQKTLLVICDHIHEMLFFLLRLSIQVIEPHPGSKTRSAFKLASRTQHIFIPTWDSDPAGVEILGMKKKRE